MSEPTTEPVTKSDEPVVTIEETQNESVRDSIAEAIARRAQPLAADEEQERRFALERDTRQEFRRLIDPGIARGNTEATLESTLKMLSTIANNLLKEPENEKFKRFKPTNPLIQKNLVDVKGALEFAIALGFRAEVVQFQPYYTFLATPQNQDRLRIGATVLTETLNRIAQKAELARLNKVDPKAVQKEIAEKVKLAYDDDRKEKKRRDELERQIRATRPPPSKNKASTSRPVDYRPPTSEDDEGDSEMMSPLPSHGIANLRGGRRLGGDPPPYKQDGEDEEVEENANPAS